MREESSRAELCPAQYLVRLHSRAIPLPRQKWLKISFYQPTKGSSSLMDASILQNSL
jgi:hypothetical protein